MMDDHPAVLNEPVTTGDFQRTLEGFGAGVPIGYRKAKAPGTRQDFGEHAAPSHDVPNQTGRLRRLGPVP